MGQPGAGGTSPSRRSSAGIGGDQLVPHVRADPALDLWVPCVFSMQLTFVAVNIRRFAIPDDRLEDLVVSRL